MVADSQESLKQSQQRMNIVSTYRFREHLHLKSPPHLIHCYSQTQAQQECDLDEIQSRSILRQKTGITTT